MESNGSDQRLMDVVLRFFEEEQWNFQKLENKPVIRVGYRGEHGTWVGYAKVDEVNRRFLFHSLMGLNISPEYRTAAAAYLMRVNALLPVGNFEMNLDTGEVYFKTSAETPGAELTVAMVRALVYTNLRAMDRYFPGMLAVVQGGLGPEAALARVEAQVIEF